MLQGNMPAHIQNPKTYATTTTSEPEKSPMPGVTAAPLEPPPPGEVENSPAPPKKQIQFREPQIIPYDSPQDSQESSFPTDQAIRQKEARKLKAEQLAESGLSPEEVKKGTGGPS